MFAATNHSKIAATRNLLEYPALFACYAFNHDLHITVEDSHNAIKELRRQVLARLPQRLRFWETDAECRYQA